MTHHVGEFQQFDRERQLERRLRTHGVSPLYGLTTCAERREHAREAILLHALADVICGRNVAGKPVTYRQTFEITYGEALVSARAPAVQTSAPAGPKPASSDTHHQGKLL